MDSNVGWTVTSLEVENSIRSSALRSMPPAPSAMVSVCCEEAALMLVVLCEKGCCCARRRLGKKSTGLLQSPSVTRRQYLGAAPGASSWRQVPSPLGPARQETWLLFSRHLRCTVHLHRRRRPFSQNTTILATARAPQAPGLAATRAPDSLTDRLTATGERPRCLPSRRRGTFSRT